MITQAICWTLLHSLWQGALAALFAGIIILCTRRSRAAVRYNLLVGDLVLFLAATTVTFCFALTPGSFRVSGSSGLPGGVVAGVSGGGAGSGVFTGGVPANGAAANGGAVNEVFIRLLPEVGINQSTGGVLQGMGNYLNAHASVIVLIWMFCLGVQLMRLSAGLYRIHTIRRKDALPAAEEWEQRLFALAQRMGIRRKVGLLQSKMVGMPSVTGVLKPVILVPVGLLAQIPAEQVETIFLHELAHIRRGDYGVNLLLHLSEAIFFFNPGIRWVATLLREEREACCDDAVLSATGDEHVYFDALVGFMLLAVGRQELAMQLAKGRTELLWRVRRMLTKENKKLHIMEKTILSFGLMAVLAVGLVSMREQEPEKATVAAGPRVATSVNDTVPVKTGEAVHGRHTFSHFTLHSNNDGDNGIFDAKGTDEQGNTFTLTEENDKVVRFVYNGKEIAKEDYGKYRELIDQIEDCANTPPVPPVPPIPPVEPVAPVAPIPPVPPVDFNVAVEPVAPIPPVEPIAPVPPVPPIPPVAPQFDYFVHHIIRELKHDKLIEHDNPLSFSLSNDGFSVNGAKQSAEIFKRYKEKFLDRPSDHFIYNHHGGSTSTEISTDRKAPEVI
jgi:bla regulator protein BlaR1